MDEDQTVDWLAVARSCVDAESWAEVVKSNLEKAMSGDRYATQFIASFVHPKDPGAESAGKVKEIRFVLAEKPSE